MGDDAAFNAILDAVEGASEVTMVAPLVGTGSLCLPTWRQG